MDFPSKCTICVLSLAISVLFSRSFVHGAEIKTNPDFQNIKVLTYAESLVLQCNETTPKDENVVLWYKEDKLLQSSDGKRPHITIEDNTLKIRSAIQDDPGNYTCKLVNSKKNNTVIEEFTYQVVGKPYVKLPATVTVIEEEKLKLECTVVGSNNPYVEWKVGNQSYEASLGRVTLSTDPVKNIKNAIFELAPAQMSDRGEVTCIGHNVATTIQSPMEVKIYVRVKDKYAALWPFLGIVAEVIVLVAVIFIYEKKRNKSELEESDTDQSPEQKNTPDHGKDSVRQRK